MEANNVKTIIQLAEFINEREDWSTEVREIIERNKWVDETGETWKVCSDGKQRIVIDEKGEAVVIYID